MGKYRGVGTRRAAPSSSCVVGYTRGDRVPRGAAAVSTFTHSSRHISVCGGGGEGGVRKER
jgi:hypothetical protein